MIAYITHDGEIFAKYTVRGNAPCDCDYWARRYAREVHDATVEQSCDKPASWIPCGGDFTVTLAERRHGGPFAASCWQSRNYYLDDEAQGE